jgi:hypothetical protein
MSTLDRFQLSPYHQNTSTECALRRAPRPLLHPEVVIATRHSAFDRRLSTAQRLDLSSVDPLDLCIFAQDPLAEQRQQDQVQWASSCAAFLHEQGNVLYQAFMTAAAVRQPLQTPESRQPNNFSVTPADRTITVINKKSQPGQMMAWNACQTQLGTHSS